MALNAIIDLLLNSAQFDSALDKSEKRIKGFAREAEKAGKIAGKISAGLNVANVAGLDKLAQGSRAAKAGLEGLTGAMLLLGTVPIPIAIGVAAIGALAAYAVQSSHAAEQTAELEKKLLSLGKTAQELQLAEAWQTAGKAAEQVLLVESELIAARAAYSEAVGEEETTATYNRVKALEAELNKWKQLEGVAHDSIKKIQAAANEKGIDGLKQMATAMEQAALKTDQGAEAAAWYAIKQGEMGKALAAGDPVATSLAAKILALARAQDEATAAAKRHKDGEKDLAAAERAREKAIQAEEAYLQTWKDWQTDNDKTDWWANQGDSMNRFADQAARNIQDITASLIKGDLAGRSFGQAIIESLRNIAAEIAAQELLKALFGSFAGTGGIIGGFADAVLGKRAAGGPVSAGKPYVVGEKGPELFVPGSSGGIVPNHAMGGGSSVTINSTINMSGGGNKAEFATVLAARDRKLKADIATYMSRGYMPA